MQIVAVDELAAKPLGEPQPDVVLPAPATPMTTTASV
jgi:hypothetical protein